MIDLQEVSLEHCSIDEMQRFINDGIFAYHQCTIERTSEALYRLCWHGYGSAGPQVLDEATTLQGVIDATKRRKMDIKHYCWQKGNRNEELQCRVTF